MKLFEKNIGNNERIVRAILGIIFLVSAMFLLGIAAYIAAIIGIIMIITAIMGSCTLYSILGINTNKAAKKEVKASSKKAKKKRK